MIYQPASSLNSSPVYTVDSSILECELKADIHSVPNLLAEMNDQLFAGSGVKIICYTKNVALKLQRHLESTQRLYLQASHL